MQFHFRCGVTEGSYWMSVNDGGMDESGETREITVEVDEWRAEELDTVAERYGQSPEEFLRRCSRYILEKERRG